MFNALVQFGYWFIGYYLIDRISSYFVDWNLFNMIIIPGQYSIQFILRVIML